MTFVLAIDGPAGAGKSSTARGVARRLGFRYLDTGALYRALALAVLRAGVPEGDWEKAVEAARRARVRAEWRKGEMRVLLEGEDVSEAIRRPEVTRLVSPLSAIPDVRRILITLQRRSAHGKGVVVEGRDIGSVVFPDAALKIFLVASIEERARRRCKELREAGVAAEFETIRREIEERDRRDKGRRVAPLVRAEGSIEVDTTHQTLEGQIERIVELAREAGA